MVVTTIGELDVTDLVRKIIKPYTRPDDIKCGSWYGGAQAESDGLILNRLSSIAVGTGSQASPEVDSTGNYRTYDTGATINSISGNRLNYRTLRGDQHAYFKTAIYPNSVTNVRIFAGLVNSTSAPASAADPLNALEGVALWLDSAVSANWKIMHNDTSGASAVDDTSVTAVVSTLYTVEILATGSDYKFTLNGTTTTINANRPATTTGLGFWIYMENTTGASRTMKNYYIHIMNDK